MVKIGDFTYKSSVAILSEDCRLLGEIVNRNFQQSRKKLFVLRKVQIELYLVSLR
jgi:hypothetical protein